MQKAHFWLIFIQVKGRKYNMLRNLRAVSVRVLAAMGVMAALLSGVACAEPTELDEKQRAALEKRVNARWQVLEKKDFGKVWEFATPKYRRVFPKSLYVNNFSYAVDWELTEVEVVNYDASAAVASVVVRVMSKPSKQTSSASKALGAVPISFREQWIFTDAKWWHSTNE
ncbi:MAG: hypothetical protein V7754_08630 [Halioglobus sp.]